MITRKTKEYDLIDLLSLDSNETIKSVVLQKDVINKYLDNIDYRKVIDLLTEYSYAFFRIDYQGTVSYSKYQYKFLLIINEYVNKYGITKEIIKFISLFPSETVNEYLKENEVTYQIDDLKEIIDNIVYIHDTFPSKVSNKIDAIFKMKLVVNRITFNDIDISPKLNKIINAYGKTFLYRLVESNMILKSSYVSGFEIADLIHSCDKFFNASSISNTLSEIFKDFLDVNSEYHYNAVFIIKNLPLSPDNFNDFVKIIDEGMKDLTNEQIIDMFKHYHVTEYSKNKKDLETLFKFILSEKDRNPKNFEQSIYENGIEYFIVVYFVLTRIKKI